MSRCQHDEITATRWRARGGGRRRDTAPMVVEAEV
jgi:hypothetical protein